MKRKFDGEFIFTAALGLFVLACLVETRNLPPALQIASYLAGFITLALIVLLAAGRFRPELLRWTETALQDLWGGSNKDAATLPPEEAPPWPAIAKSMGYAVGFLGFSFLLGLVLVPPIFLSLYLIVEAKVPAIWAVLSGVVATALLMTGMHLVHIDVWVGAIPEIIPGLLGGSIIPPI